MAESTWEKSWNKVEETQLKYESHLVVKIEVFRDVMPWRLLDCLSWRWRHYGRLIRR